GETVLDLVEVGGRHGDSLERVLGGEDDMLLALAGFIEGNVGDLLVLAVDLIGIVEGVDFDRLAVDVVFPGGGKLSFASAEFGDDLGGRDSGGRSRIEFAEARSIIGAGG